MSAYEEPGDRREPDPQEIPHGEPLADEPTARGEGAEAERTGIDSDFEDEPEPPAERRPIDPVRSLLRLGWAMVAMLVVVAVLLIVGMVRISNAVNNVACVQRAQTGYLSSTGPGSNAYTAGLGRLALRLTLSRCGH